MTILDTIGQTRLLPLRHMVPEGSARILVKLEYGNPTGSMKDGSSRVVRWLSTRAEARACRSPLCAPRSASRFR
jgi:cysteine synthase